MPSRVSGHDELQQRPAKGSRENPTKTVSIKATARGNMEPQKKGKKATVSRKETYKKDKPAKKSQSPSPAGPAGDVSAAI